MGHDEVRRSVSRAISDELLAAARLAGLDLHDEIDEIDDDHHILLPRVGPFVDRRDWFVRPEDLLVLRAYPVNLQVDVTTPLPTLARQSAGPMYLIVEFPPQHLDEEAFFQTAAGYALMNPPKLSESKTTPEPDPDLAAATGDETPTDDTPPVQSIIAGMSRIVLKVADGDLPIDWTLAGILEALAELPLSVTSNSQRPTAPRRFTDHMLGKILRTGISDQIRTRTISAVQRVLLRSGVETEIAVEATVTQAAATSALQVAGASRARRAIRLADNTLGLSTETGEVTRDLDQRLLGGLLEIDDQLDDHHFVIRPEPSEPTTTQTAIEAPYQLFLSPTVDGTWFHESASRTSTETGHTELWHTRLGSVQADGSRLDGQDPRRVVRAVWTTDGPPEVTTPEWGMPVPTGAHVDFPYRTPLDGFDRHNFVHLSSNYALEDPKTGDYYEPPAIDVDLLMLSSLGAWLDTRGAWEVPQPRGLSVEEWRHRATLGRDHYVRVVYTGCLLPFGHRASLIKISERQFHEQLRGSPAYLRQRMFVLVRQPLKTFRHSGLTYDKPGDPRDGESFDRMMPFDAVRITTRVSPFLDEPTSDTAQPHTMSSFWPRVANQPFKFHVIATDTTGNETHLAMPMIFVGKEVTDNTYAGGHIDQISASYEDPTHARSVVQAGGQKIAMAEQGAPDDTASTIRTLTFGAQLPSEAKYNSMDWREPRFVPVVRSAGIDVPSMQRIAGTNEPAEVVLAHHYLVSGFGPDNPGQLFLASKPGAAQLKVAFSKQADRSGALLAPDLALTGVSRITGPVSGKLDDAAAGSFKPADWFGALLGAKLFGAFPLSDVLDLAGLDDLTKIPRFAGQSLNVVEQLVSGLDLLRSELAAAGGGDAATQAVRTRVDQLVDPATGILAGIVAPSDTPAQRDTRIASVVAALLALQAELVALEAALPGGAGLPPGALTLVRARVDAVGSVLDHVLAATGVLKAFAVGDQLPEAVDARFDWRPLLKPTAIFKPDNLRGLVLSVAIASKLEGAGDERVTVSASLESFTLDLTFVIISFEHLQFRVRDGKKPEIDVAMKDFGFGGPLSFVNTLREIIPLDGFSDPPDVKVTADGITAGYAIGLPNIAVGVFSLENLAISAGFTIPFIGPPMSAYFHFCERHDPARVTVTLFGGGFFFGVTVNADGLFLIEAAIEFGAAASVDFGVASGSVSIMAGIYFAMQGKDAHLTGYFRMRGEVEALGIVSVSIELYLELSYETSTGKCIGTASLTLEIDIAMFSTSITITQSKKFAGGNADPTFAELVEAVDDPVLGLLSDDWDLYCRAFA